MPEKTEDQQQQQQQAATLTQADLHNAAEKARLEERAKLRAEIDAATKRATDAEAQVTKLTADLQKVTTDLETLQASIKKDGGGVDVEALINQVTNRLEGQFQAQITQLQGELNTERSTRQKLTLDQRRAQMIIAAGGEDALIPALVTGSNEQEIAVSIEASKAEFAKIKSKFGGTTTTTQQSGNGNGSGSQNPPAMQLPQGGSGAGANGGASSGIKSARQMSRAEYAEHRQQLKKNAASRYPNNNIMQG